MKLISATAVVTILAMAQASSSELKFAPGDGAFSWETFEAFSQRDYTGQVVTVFGPWLGPDAELVESMLAYFEAATGADVRYNGSDSSAQQIIIDTSAGSPPDVAVIPQPGLLKDLAADGHAKPLDVELADWIRQNYAAGQSWVDLATFEGSDGQRALFGHFYKVDVKSLVWYSPENFEDAGYAVPESMEDLKALTDQIVADGGTPWCLGLGSGAATGWPATDWVEEMVLRTQPPEVYDDWTSNTIPFDDPRIIAAIEEFGAFARNGDYIAGGVGGGATTDFRDSPDGLFSSPPQCYLHRQASFIPTFFPDGMVVGEDADFFYFPAYEQKGLGRPVLGAGTVWAVMTDNEAARGLIEFLTTPIAHEVWMAQSGFLTPHKQANVDVFADPTLAKMNQILLDADTFRFDGSDLMPAGVGAGAFWTGMIDYVGGADAAEVAGQIQAAWDGLK